jgi:hypothetical protein
MPANPRISGQQGSGAVVESFHNYSTALAEGVLVKVDANLPAAAKLGGCVATAATTDKNVLGITLEAIAAGADGRVLTGGGIAVCTAAGAITYGDPLMPGSVAGTVSTRTTGKPFVGWARASAADTAQVPVLVHIVDPS